MDVIVVGGGFAGVTAARDLQATGLSVLLLEGRHRLGGRTYYRSFEGREQKLEMGGTWISPEHQPHVGEELRRYGIGTFQSPEAQDFAWGLAGKVLRDSFPIPADEWVDAERALTYINQQAARLRFGDGPLGQDGLADLDIPYDEFVAALKLPDITRDFLLAWPSFYFGAYPDKLSALHVLSWVTGFHNSAVAWYTSLTDKISGGTKNLIDAMAADGAVDIRLGQPISGIVQNESGVEVTTRSGDVFRARAAVVATPINTWSSTEFTPPLQGSHGRMAVEKQAGQSVKIWALVRGLDRGFFGVGMHTTIKWLAAEYWTDEGTYVVGFASAAADLDPADKDAVARAVREFLPDVEVIASDAHDWNADEFSQGTWMAYRPGQVMQHSAELQRTHGRLAFANSDLASGWAGWIDGAIESGRRAATDITALLAHAAPTDLQEISHDR